MTSSFTTDPYRPRRYLSNGHVQTIVGNFLRRQNQLPAAEPNLVDVEEARDGQSASFVLCHCHWQPARSDKLTVILVHGLEGSSSSQYIVGNANKLWRAGVNVIRMNMRNCGGTERLSPTLYHSGLSEDILRVMTYFKERDGLTHISLVGYSMGGNLVLKLAGDLGAAAPPYLRAVVAVSPAIDLGPSADALHEPLNRLYERRFLRALLRRFRRKCQLFPGRFDWDRATGIRTLRDFDDRITAFYSGFAGADDYYFRAAAARVLQHICVPTLVLHAEDDPFIRMTVWTRSLLKTNPSITFVPTSHGGHCAFLSQPGSLGVDDGYWAESTLLRFLTAQD